MPSTKRLNAKWQEMAHLWSREERDIKTHGEFVVYIRTNSGRYASIYTNMFCDGGAEYGVGECQWMVPGTWEDV